MHGRIAQQSLRYPERNADPSGTGDQKWMAGPEKRETSSVVRTRGTV
ncbi:hypothetical protein LFML04_2153 [Leptospirillum ferriphilum ML-04]|uniref:Uncharacterized protein n=1 Tax=Leptospirillum ferriphilum (strain ML-04) TaxID=1048260 RepID=J9ZEP7_LEPFM|nr:hypothetical protein LFML04_2153 [Leptospirillum ferriphilum ML-04]